MKKLLFLWVLVLTTFSLKAQSKVLIGDLYYNLYSDNTAEVTAPPSGEYGNLNNLIIPASVEHEGVSYSVTSIGEDAFYDCLSLTSITIPNSVTSIGEDAFNRCYSLTSITIPESVTSIGDYAFSACLLLTSITIPNSVTSIGYCAFNSCYALTSITIPNSVTSIGDRAFIFCNALNSIVVAEGNPNYDSRGNCNAIIETATNTLISGCKSTIIPNSVTSIGNDAFHGYWSLTSIIIPNSVTSIGDYAFNNCESLASITIPNSVTSIGYQAFSSCESLTSIIVPNSVTSIGDRAFLGCSSLTSIIIPKSVTSIGDDAFYSCDALTSVTIEANTPPTIGTDLFTSNPVCTVPCGTLTVYQASDWAQYVSEFVEGCEEPIDPTWRKITYTSTDGTIVTPNATDVFGANIVSNTYENGQGVITFNVPVTSIGDDAFRDCRSLTSITIPNSVTSIGNYAFYRCEALTSITIPESVTSIEYSAFRGCSSLTSITIPKSVTSIGNEAFYSCYALTSITIPESVTSIGEEAFASCDALSSIVVAEGNPNYDSRGNCNAIIKTATNTLISGCKSTIIPNSVTSIGNYAFYGCEALTSITIPNSVTSIGNYAFNGCSSLTSITIPESVTSIGYYAFEECSSLTSITIPNSVTSIGFYAFYRCEALTSITIPESVTSIGFSAFSRCTSLTSVTIEANTPPTIGTNLFTSNPVCTIPCGTLTAYQASDWAQYVSEFVEECEEPIDPTWQILYTSTDGNIVTPNATDVFGANIVNNTYENGVGTITFDGPVTSIGERAFFYCDDLTSITIPNTITSIGEMAFYYCDDLTSITIPNSVTSIGRYAFSGCDALTSMVVEAGNSKYDSRESCNAIIETATNTLIAGCQNTVIPNTVTSIGEYAFWACNLLTSITIPNSVTSIGRYAFSGCDALTSMVVEAGNSKYDSRESCNAIIETATNTLIAGCQNTVIPNTITSIGEDAFNSCGSLTSITIPNSVTSIGDGAFFSCYSLTFITCEAVTPPTFLGCCNVFSYNLNVSVPCGTKAAYEASDWASYSIISFIEEECEDPIDPIDPTWQIFYTSTDGEIVTPGSGTNVFGANIVSNTYENGQGVITFDGPVTSIGDQAFWIESALTSITIPNSVTSIGNDAFCACENLISITIPNSVTSIGARVFSGCYALTSVTIPNSVKSIGNDAFRLCSSLTSITIPESVTSLGDGVFNQCSSLTSITIPNNVKSIGDNMFSYCSSLTSITIPNSVTSIGKYAFNSCSSLTAITIPECVTSIGIQAFMSCKVLTTITIPNSVTSIGQSAFSRCTSLNSITIEANTPPTIGTDLFSSNPVCTIPCRTLTAYQASDWAQYVSEFIEEGCEEPIDPTWQILYTSTNGKIVTPNATKVFGANIVNNTYENGVGTITFDGPVTSIGNYAFYDCNALTSVTIPNSVTSIGSHAFWGCWSLTSITIPESVTSIGDYAFICYKLTSIIIPNSVTSIGENAFWSCYALTSVTIGESVTSIGEQAFSDCDALNSIVVAEGNPNYDSRGNCNAIIETATNTLISGCKSTIIPNSVTSIGNYAFYDCDALTSITIPNSVTSIGGSAFSSCGALTSITIPESVTSIGVAAFSACIALTSITIPESVTSIGKLAFSSCRSLTSITIPESVTSIGEKAFTSCDALNSIVVAERNPNYDSRGNCNAIIETATNTLISGCKSTIIPESVTSIGYSAFEECESLTSITIPESVTSIRSNAFSYCYALTSVTIGENVTSIGDYAFLDCESLTSIIIPKSVTSIGSHAFYIPNLKVCCEGDAPATIESSVFKSNAKIYVPNVEEYKTAWSTYASQITSAEFTYTLFGDAALGLSMDANNAAQQMQLQSVGTYTLSKTDISLSEGTYSYTARRTSEAPCFEPEDITSTLSITTAGKYDITFTLNPATDELTAQVTLKEPEQLNQPDKLYFHPSTVWKEAGARFAAHFLSTTNESWVNMSDADGDGIYEVENPKTYNQIRFCRIDPNATSENISNNVWQATNTLQIPNNENDNALNTCYAFYKNDWSLDGTWVVPTPLTANNCWTIINTYQNQTINIVVERQFFDIGEWYTLCLPFSCNASIFGEAHQFASLDVANDIVTIMTSLHNTIEAGAPYLFRPLSSYDHFIVENVKIPSFVTPQTISVSGGGFTISLTSVLQTEGTTDGAYWIGSGGYLYNNDVDKLGLRAYFNISKPAGMAPRFRVSTSEENATGFDILIDKENHTMKILENGQLVILRNGEKYNIQGQKL